MNKKLIFFIIISVVLVISFIGVGTYIVFHTSDISNNADIPYEPKELEYDYNVYPDGHGYSNWKVNWEFNFSIGGSGIYYGNHYVILQTVDTVVIIMDQHQWAIYEDLVYYRDYGDIIRRDVDWSNYVDHYILSI